MAEYLRSGLAKIAGLNIETIRYYEKKGLITPERLANGYRTYPEAILDRLHFIKRAKEAGFTLEEIRRTLQLIDRRLDCRDFLRLMTEGLRTKIRNIDSQIDSLKETRAILQQMEEGLRQQQVCPTLQELLKKTGINS